VRPLRLAVTLRPPALVRSLNGTDSAPARLYRL